MLKIDCKKRQKVVNRIEGLTSFRCINKECGAYGQTVSDDMCSACPVRQALQTKKCKPKPSAVKPPPTQEQLVKDVKEMIKDSPLAEMEVEGLEIKPEGEGPTPEYPALSMQLWLYKEALMRWNKAGRPTRSDEEVKHIHDTHCANCAWYDKEKHRCKGCGCKVTVGSVAVFNKIKMATESCPQGLW